MKLRMDNIDIYNNSAIILNNNNPFYIRIWTSVLIILIILFIFISFVPFNIYKTYNGYIVIDDNNSYVNIKLENKDFPINKNKKLYIDNNRYKYEILGIKDNNVLLSIKLKSNIKINNNIVTVNILKDRTNLFKIIKNKIKKGFDV